MNWPTVAWLCAVLTAALLWLYSGLALCVLLVSTRVESLWNPLFGFAVWARVISNDGRGLNLDDRAEFAKLRRRFITAFLVALVVLIVPPVAYDLLAK